MLESYKHACLVSLMVDYDTPVAIHQCKEASHSCRNKGDNEAWLVAWRILRPGDKKNNKILDPVVADGKLEAGRSKAKWVIALPFD